MTDTVQQRRFSGIARLYGAQALERFSRARVLVVGVGGVGSWAVEALARSGIGGLVLIDLDHVAESNINRQLQALECTLGKAKVAALAERVAQINPACQVETIEEFVSHDNLETLIPPGSDYLLDCIDNYRLKAALIAHCKDHDIPMITSGGAGGRIDPTRVQLADLSRSEQDPLLAKTRRQLRQEHGFPADPKRRFGVPCVFSAEPLRQPVREEAQCEVAVEGSLNCAGFGSVMTVTAGFGLVATSHLLTCLAEGCSHNNACPQ